MEVYSKHSLGNYNSLFVLLTVITAALDQTREVVWNETELEKK